MNLKTLEDAAFIWNTGWAITCSREYESMTCENIHKYKYMSNRNAGQATTFWRVQRSRAPKRSRRRARRTWRRRRRRGRSARKMARDPRFCILTWEFFGLISCWIKVTLTFYGYIPSCSLLRMEKLVAEELLSQASSWWNSRKSSTLKSTSGMKIPWKCHWWDIVRYFHHLRILHQYLCCSLSERSQIAHNLRLSEVQVFQYM